MIHHGDCLDVMRTMEANSVDSIVTDPPYGLVEPRSKASSTGMCNPRTEEDKALRRGGFMGKKWDANVPGVPFWEAALRVIKPGGYMLAFGGTRTVHRLVCAIEDAGWEIRDSIMWLHNQPVDLLCNCRRNTDGSPLPYTHEKRSKIVVDSDVPSLQKDVPDTNLLAQKSEDSKLLPTVQRKATRSRVEKARGKRKGGLVGGNEGGIPAQESGSEQSSMEGRSDLPETAGELCPSEVHSVPEGTSADGETGRVCDGASGDNGEACPSLPHTNGSCASHRPQAAEQRSDEPRTLARQPEPQESGVGHLCDRCGKPTVMPWGWDEKMFSPYFAWNYGSGFPKGKGCLKPAWEPIILSRKPGKVLPLGIDACRVKFASTADKAAAAAAAAQRACQDQNKGRHAYGEFSNGPESIGPYIAGMDAGRWPANLIHDGSEEVLAGFPNSEGTGGSKSGKTALGQGSGWNSHNNRDTEIVRRGDTGSAARFFYCAKASKADRDEGLGEFGPRRKRNEQPPGDAMGNNRRQGNHHPTVKPTSLMRYLCKLITPHDGLILDPFAGSGSTGKAAMLEGFRFIGIEKEAEYVEIARRRIAAVKSDLYAEVA